MLDLILSYFTRSTFITIFVLSWLSIYFIVTVTILVSRYVGLSAWQHREAKALESLLMGGRISLSGSIFQKINTEKISKEALAIYKGKAERDSTSGLTWLSIIASTSPFIGLFGTVVSILENISKIGGGNSRIETIPAYTFSLLIKRKAYEVMSIISRTADILLFKANTGKAI